MQRSDILIISAAFIVTFIFYQVSGQQKIHSDQFNPDKSVINILNITGNLSDSAEITRLFNSIFELSEEKRQHGYYGEAMQLDFYALQLAENYSYMRETGKAYNNIAISYYRNRSFKKAEKYFLDAAAIRLYMQDTTMLADTYYNLGMLYDDVGSQSKAYEYYSKSLDLFRSKNIIDGMADVYNGLAGHYYYAGKTDSVEYYASRALEMYTLLEDKDAMAFMLINIGALKNSRRKHHEAITDILQGISIARETNNLNQLRQGYKNLSETYSFLGDYENAWLNLMQYVAFKDSVFNMEKAQIIEELQTKYETDKALKELNQKKAELLELEVQVQKTKNIRNIALLAVFIVLLITAALWWRYLENRKHTKILDQKNMELAELNSTKDKFFSIISHDLRSPVTSMDRLTGSLEKSLDQIDRDELKEYLSELSRTTRNLNEFLKKLLDWALSQKKGFKPVYTKLNAVDLLNDVVETAKTQANLKNIRITCDNSVNRPVMADKQMIQTVIRNLASNALKFSPENSEIIVRAENFDKHVKFSVTNTGPGISDEDLPRLFKIDGKSGMISDHPEKGSGLGLILCNEFVKLHNGNIFVESNSPENTCFAFTIPENQQV